MILKLSCVQSDRKAQRDKSGPKIKFSKIPLIPINVFTKKFGSLNYDNIH